MSSAKESCFRGGAKWIIFSCRIRCIIYNKNYKKVNRASLSSESWHSLWFLFCACSREWQWMTALQSLMCYLCSSRKVCLSHSPVSLSLSLCFRAGRSRPLPRHSGVDDTLRVLAGRRHPGLLAHTYGRQEWKKGIFRSCCQSERARRWDGREKTARIKAACLPSVSVRRDEECVCVPPQ